LVVQFVTKWKGKEKFVLPRIQLIMEEMATAKSKEWMTNEEIRNRVESDAEIVGIVGKPISAPDAMIMVNWISRGYDQVEKQLEVLTKGQTIDEILSNESVPSYAFSDEGFEALMRIHEKFARSSRRPFAYRLRETSE
jgi:hypothetical protein